MDLQLPSIEQLRRIAAQYGFHLTDTDLESFRALMIGSLQSYQRVAELQITLPEADADAAKQRPKEVNVGIDAQGRYVIDKNVFTFSTVGALGEMLRKAAGDTKDPVVIINADANATHQSVIHVMEAARQVGLVHITFATQTPAK